MKSYSIITSMLSLFIGVCIGLHFRKQESNPVTLPISKPYDSSNHDHWVGKMDYYFAVFDVIVIEQHVNVSESAWRKIEQRYVNNSKQFGYTPYVKK